jgi:HNH endonuclease
MSIVNEWLCDCEYTRIITGNSQVLDVGRKTRVIPLPLRKAVILRDRQCRFSGCHMPARFNDIHHIVHWTKNGPTTRKNCASLCRFHHRLIHNGGWTITGNADETLIITAPDGTRYHSPPPPIYHHPTLLPL